MTARLVTPGARVREAPSSGTPYALFRYTEWERRFPGTTVGVTAAAPGADFGLSRAPSRAELRRRYETLGRQLGFGSQAVARQVHGREIRKVERPGRPGLWLAGAADGLVTDRVGILCCVTAADCAPVYLLDPSRRALGLLHAGWRGTAAGVLEAGFEAMATEYGSEPTSLFVHLGPAICGDCYEVGAEVPRALGLAGEETESEPDGARSTRTVDLRAELIRRSARLGVRLDRMSVSSWCTRCNSDHFHSHRGKGSRAGRMAAFFGWPGGDAAEAEAERGDVAETIAPA